MLANLLRAQIEQQIPKAFSIHPRSERGSVPTGITSLDAMTAGGVPLHSLTEICGSSIAFSGKASVMVSLLAQASRDRFCALVDASDAFHPETGQAAGINFARLLWVRCGKTKQKLRPLEQAFKVTDMLLQSSGFGLIVVDLSDIPEKVVRDVPISSWFRFSRVVESQPTALVFIEQHPHATSCAGLVLKLCAARATFTGKLLTGFTVNADVIRTRERKSVRSSPSDFSIKAQWA
jgi:recA bacterial DNA recombination protein